jgi:hypothetical protein
MTLCNILNLVTFDFFCIIRENIFSKTERRSNLMKPFNILNKGVYINITINL